MSNTENQPNQPPEPPHFTDEDPLHGTAAIEGLLRIPPMPRGDGTYYRAGGYYTQGSLYEDANGEPVPVTIGRIRPTSAVIRESFTFEEWRQASLLGEDALTALEAQRQQERLDSKGIAHAFKPSDVCGGGKRLDACETAQAMNESAQDYTQAITQRKDRVPGKFWNISASLGSRVCDTCSLVCEIAVEVNDGHPTGITRFSSMRSLAESVVPTVISLDDE